MDVDSDSDISLLGDDEARARGKGKSKATDKRKKGKGKGKAKDVRLFFTLPPNLHLTRPSSKRTHGKHPTRAHGTPCRKTSRVACKGRSRI